MTAKPTMKEFESRQPIQSPGGQLPGQPPRLGAVARTLGFAKMLSNGGIVLLLLAAGAEKVLLPEYRPSTMIGNFAGRTETAEIKAKQEASVDLLRLQAEAQAYANARAQMEAEIARKQQEKVGEALGVKSFFAQTADVACMVGQFIPTTAADPNTRNMGEGLRQTCGAGDQMRQEMARDLANAGRDGSSIIPRGAPPPPTQEVHTGPRYTIVPADPPPTTQAQAAPRFRPYGNN